MDKRRRQILKSGVIALASCAIPSPLMAQVTNANKVIDLKMAGYPYEHVQGIITKRVGIDRCDTTFEVDKIGNLNTHLFSGSQTRGISEVGLSPFILAFANEEFRDYSLIPVFPLRTFRHKSIFVRTDSNFSDPLQLRGKRIGTPGYSSTSLTWIRGILQDEYGLTPEDIEWVVSAEDSAVADTGQVSKFENVFPEGLAVSTGPAGKDDSDLLLDGYVDALFHAAEPRAFAEGNPNIRRLFTDVRSVEQAYFSKTGIFPIMHAVAIRNDLVAQHPWLPEAVFNAYSKSKVMAYSESRQKWFYRTLPWHAQELEATEELMGENFLPYGIEANRKALNALFRYQHEQGLASRQLTIEEVFTASTLELTES